jgi:PAS domain S-box-containing protein
MLRKTQLVWKVNGVILVILVSVLGVLSYVTNVVYEGDALRTAREISRVNSRTIHESIRELMMRRDTAGMGDLFGRLLFDSPVYRDIRLVSHGGQVVASSLELSTRILEPDSWPCSVCHASNRGMSDSILSPFDEVVSFENGERAVSVVTPIYGEDSCEAAGCHLATSASPVLGLLQADFSLRSVDSIIAQRNRHTVIALLVALILITVSTWWMMDRLVGRRIRILREGAERVARKDFSFRFRDSRGDGIARLSGTFDNMVSELSSTLTELQSTKDYMQGIVEGSADIIITVDTSGLIKTFNSGAENTLGYSQSEVIGKRIEMLFAEPAERDEAIARLANTDHVVNYETHFLTKNGEIRDVILTLSRLRDPDGEPIGTFGISKDITREKELQRELVESERLAAIGDTVTGLAHCLKNLLNGLRAGQYVIEFAIEKEDREKLLAGWRAMKNSVGHVEKLIFEMLYYAKKRVPDLNPTNLNEIILEAIETLREMAAGRGVELRAELDQGMGEEALDATTVHRAIVCLVTNAVDACADSESGDVVILKSQVARREIVLTVDDNGIGMSEAVLSKLFTRFFSTKEAKGTGLGLLVVKKIAEEHGGRLEVESAPNKGSTFRIRFPRIHATDQPLVNTGPLATDRAQ